ncbi:MAG: prephenate dehydrogenase [Halioglobus sp.]
MTYKADTVVIVGLGLIGGSLARALRASGFSKRFVGYGHRTPSLERGVELGVIDEYTLDIDHAVSLADVIVICTPTLTAATLLEQLMPRVIAVAESEGRMIAVTDGASVKGNLHKTALAMGGGKMPGQLVLGHPIAGSENSGVEASRADLYRDHRVILTPEPGNDSEAVALIRAMWESTGAEVLDMSVEQHDLVLAATSHLPHVLAYALVDALARSERGEDIFRYAAGGFRDFTRIASSDPVMWRDISIANKEALLKSLDGFTEHLAALRDAIANEDAQQLEATFSEAKRARDAFAAASAPPSGES